MHSDSLVEVLEVDPVSGRYGVLRDARGQIFVGHWKPFKDAGFPSLARGAVYRVRIAVDERDQVTPRVTEVAGRETDPEPLAWPAVHVCEGRRFSTVEAFLAEMRQAGELVIIRDCDFDVMEHEGLTLSVPVLFAQCRFHGDFRLVNSRFAGSVVFSQCRFERHFSLKGARVADNLVFLGCDYSGPGGVSLRGLQARSVFMEYDTAGPSDMTWLNDMNLSGCLSLCGAFPAPVQIAGIQDEDSPQRRPFLQRILIGRRAYANEVLSGNRFEGGIVLSDYYVQGAVEVTRAVLRELQLSRVSAARLALIDCEVERDLVLRETALGDAGSCLRVEHSNIGRAFNILGASRLGGDVSLDFSTVEKSLVFEEVDWAPGKGLSSRRFHAGAVWFEPVELIYGQPRRRHWLRPPSLRILARARMIDGWQCDAELAEEYTLLKRWLGDSGHMEEEDHALFYMRQAKERSLFKKALMGGVFGWGIRLRNILISSLLVVMLFALVLWQGFGFTLPGGILFSAQAFISSFFGAWADYPPVGLLSLLVTLQSVVGIVFITVFVGAYVRKMLR
ncbi:pentapeptide repeat-containing protein [Marinobacteraceae bacterium S3BR75-40.1]